MKPPQLGLALGLAVVAVLGAMVLLSKRNQPAEGVAPESLNRQHSAYRLFVNLGCLRCHGPDLAGTHKGPGLGNLQSRWDAERLRRFLQDPQPFREHDRRLADLSARYADFEMPAYELVDSVLVDLSEFLLNPGSP